MAVRGMHPKFRLKADNGDPLIGGKVYTYSTGTTAAKKSYTSAVETVPTTNPVILDSRGEANIWFNSNYKLKVTDKDDVEIYTLDNYNTQEVSESNGIPPFIYFTSVDDAVNQVGFSNSVTTSGPILAPVGDDPNIDLILSGMGSGSVTFNDNTNFSADFGMNGGSFLGLDGLAILKPVSGYTDLYVEFKSSDGGNPIMNGALMKLDAATGSEVYFGQATTMSAAETSSCVESASVNGVAAAGGYIQLPEGTNNGSHYRNIQAPALIETSHSITLPNNPTNNYLVQTNGSGVWSYIDPAAVDLGLTAATDSAEGIVELATSAEVFVGTDTSRAIVPAYQHRHESSCKAWVSYDQTTPTIRDSYNVTSVTDVGAGEFAVVIDNNMSNFNYRAGVQAYLDDTGTSAQMTCSLRPVVSTTYIQVAVGAGGTDYEYNFVTIHGDVST